MIKLMEKELFGMFMVTSMKVTGNETKPLVKVNILIVMEHNMMVNGKTVNTMEREKKQE